LQKVTPPSIPGKESTERRREKHRMNDLQSRTRPGHQPNSDVAALRAIRQATRDYLIVLAAALRALDNGAIAGKPELAYLRNAISVAAGARGTSYSFGTPANIERPLSRALGEAP